MLVGSWPSRWLQDATLYQSQLCSGLAFSEVHLIKRLPDDVQAQTSRLHQIQRAADQLFRDRRRTEVAQLEHDSVFQPPASQHDDVAGRGTVGVTDDVRTRFIHPENHGLLFVSGKSGSGQKLPDNDANGSEVLRVAEESEK